MSPLRRPNACHVRWEGLGCKAGLAADAGAPHMRGIDKLVGAVENDWPLSAGGQVTYKSPLHNDSQSNIREAATSKARHPSGRSSLFQKVKERHLGSGQAQKSRASRLV